VGCMMELSLLRLFCSGNDDGRVVSLAKGVQQIEQQYRFIISKVKHELCSFLCLEIQRSFRYMEGACE
jgi:hypothetical protein